MIRVFIGRGGQQQIVNLVQGSMITSGNLSTAFDRFRKSLQTEGQHGRLQIIQPGIQPPGHHVTRFISPVITQQKNLMRYSIVVGDHGSTITKTPQHLGWIKTERAGYTKGASAPSLVSRAQALGGIFDDQQAMPVGNCPQRIHITSASIELDWHNHPGLGGNRGFNSGRFDQMIPSTLDQYRRCVNKVDRRGRGHVGMRGQDHLVATAYTGSAKRNDQSIRAVAYSESILDIQEPGQVLFEILQIPLQDESTPG